MAPRQLVQPGGPLERPIAATGITIAARVTRNGREPTPKLTDRELRELCVSLIRLVLRHEDQFSIDRTECGSTLFLQTQQGAPSMMPEQVKVSEVEGNSDQGSHGHHAPAPDGSPATPAPRRSRLQKASDMLSLDDRNHVPYLGWDREEQRLRIRPDKEPMTRSKPTPCSPSFSL